MYNKNDLVKMELRDSTLIGEVLEATPSSIVVKWKHPAFPEPDQINDLTVVEMHWSKKDQDALKIIQLQNLLNRLKL